MRWTRLDVSVGRSRKGIYPLAKRTFRPYALISHETACILNAGDADAHVAITIFFSDRNPAGRTA